MKALRDLCNRCSLQASSMQDQRVVIHESLIDDYLLSAHAYIIRNSQYLTKSTYNLSEPSMGLVVVGTLYCNH